MSVLGPSESDPSVSPIKALSSGIRGTIETITNVTTRAKRLARLSLCHLFAFIEITGNVPFAFIFTLVLLSLLVGRELGFPLVFEDSIFFDEDP